MTLCESVLLVRSVQSLSLLPRPRPAKERLLLQGRSSHRPGAGLQEQFWEDEVYSMRAARRGNSNRIKKPRRDVGPCGCARGWSPSPLLVALAGLGFPQREYPKRRSWLKAAPLDEGASLLPSCRLGQSQACWGSREGGHRPGVMSGHGNTHSCGVLAVGPSEKVVINSTLSSHLNIR